MVVSLPVTNKSAVSPMTNGFNVFNDYDNFTITVPNNLVNKMWIDKRSGIRFQIRVYACISTCGSSCWRGCSSQTLDVVPWCPTTIMWGTLNSDRYQPDHPPSMGVMYKWRHPSRRGHNLYRPMHLVTSQFTSDEQANQQQLLRRLHGEAGLSHR